MSWSSNRDVCEALANVSDYVIASHDADYGRDNVAAAICDEVENGDRDHDSSRRHRVILVANNHHQIDAVVLVDASAPISAQH